MERDTGIEPACNSLEDCGLPSQPIPRSVMRHACPGAARLGREAYPLRGRECGHQQPKFGWAACLAIHVTRRPVNQKTAKDFSRTVEATLY